MLHQNFAVRIVVRGLRDINERSGEAESVSSLELSNAALLGQYSKSFLVPFKNLFETWTTWTDWLVEVINDVWARKEEDAVRQVH